MMEFSTSSDSFQHLSYCTGIQTGANWSDVIAELHYQVPQVKQSLRSHDSFGIGLQLSAQAANELANPYAFAELREFLSNNQCYVFTLKGFNTDLFNWKDPKQLECHNNLASIFSQVLPPQITGSISTVPGAPKEFVCNDADSQAITKNWVSHAEHLIRLERQTGKHIVLAVQAESLSFLETIRDCADFFNEQLFSKRSCQQLSSQLNVDLDVAEDLLRTHLTLCVDITQAQREYTSFQACKQAMESLGISIGKQLLNTDSMHEANLSDETVVEITTVMQQLEQQTTRFPMVRAA